MSLEEIPKFDMWKEGTEIRRSSKKVMSEIVEAYNKKSNKQIFIQYLTSAIDSNNETIDNLKTLFNSGSLTDKQYYEDLSEKLVTVGTKLHDFIQTVEREHQSKKR